MSLAAAYAVSRFLTASSAGAYNRVDALLLTASRHRTTIQQAVGEPLNAAHDRYHVLIGFQCIEMFVEDILDNLAEIKNIFGSRGVDDRDCRREVLVRPVTAGCDGSLELGCGELAEAVGLVFDGHRKHLGMLDYVAFDIQRRKSNGACRRSVGERGAVIEQIEVFDHEFHDLRVVAYIGAVGAILHCCKLDNSGLSLLSVVSGGLVNMEVGCRTLNVPFFRAVSKYTDWLQITALCAANVYGPHVILQSECLEDV